VTAIDAAERTMYRRIYGRLIPFLMLLYLICYIDRVNIGFAKLQFLPQLGLNDAQFGLASGLFFITYSLFDIPSNLMLARIGVRKTLLRIMIVWGALSAAQMFIQGAASLYVLRILFGAAEAGFIPGIMLYLNLLVPQPSQGTGHQPVPDGRAAVGHHRRPGIGCHYGRVRRRARAAWLAVAVPAGGGAGDAPGSRRLSIPAGPPGRHRLADGRREAAAGARHGH